MTKRSLFPAFAVAFVFALLPLPGSLSAAEESEQAAQAAAEQWLALIDAGQYGPGWQNAAPFFKNQISEAQLRTTLETVRKPLGNVVSRKLKRARSTKNVPGAPNGAYVILQFATDFANQKDAVETVTPMLTPDGRWKVSGYFIK